jgi:hypothetical protein
MYGLLIAFHIAAGTIALIAAAAALASSKGDRWHVYAGRAFTLGMVVVFLTAVPMTLMRPNLFLLLIAVFSFYLASTGWLRARNRGGEPLLAEWIAASAMGVTAIAMCVRGVVDLRAGNSMGVVLLAFGGIGGSYAISDLYSLRRHRYRGTFRIADHLSRMLAGTIAAVTAFTVVNVRLEPPVLVWLTPTAVLTPVIVYWNLRVRRQTTSGGTPSRKMSGVL